MTWLIGILISHERLTTLGIFSIKYTGYLAALIVTEQEPHCFGAARLHQPSKSCCSDLRSYKRRANPAVHVRFGYPGYSAPTHEPHSPPCPGLCQTIHHRRTVFNILLEGTELSSYRDVLNVHTLTPEMSGTWVLIPDFLTLQMCSPWGTRIASTDAGREAQ